MNADDGSRRRPTLESSNAEYLTKDCLNCDGFGTVAVRNSLGVASGYAYCDCPAGARRAQTEASRGDAGLVEDWNRDHWPLSLCIMASPSSLLTAARPVGLNSRAFSATWPGRPITEFSSTGRGGK